MTFSCETWYNFRWKKILFLHSIMFLLHDHDMRPLLNLCSCLLLQILEFCDLIGTLSVSLYSWKMCLSHLLVNSTSAFFIDVNNYGQILSYHVHNLTSAQCPLFWLYISTMQRVMKKDFVMWSWKLMSRKFYWIVLSAWVTTVSHCPSGCGSEAKVTRRGSCMRFGRQSWRSHDSVLCTVRRQRCMGT